MARRRRRRRSDSNDRADEENIQIGIYNALRRIVEMLEDLRKQHHQAARMVLTPRIPHFSNADGSTASFAPVSVFPSRSTEFRATPPEHEPPRPPEYHLYHEAGWRWRQPALARYEINRSGLD